MCCDTERMSPMRHIIDFSDITMDEWHMLYKQCCDIISSPEDFSHVCSGKIMGSLFFEPSTRTNFSFRAAMQRLGGTVIGFADPQSSSVSKGESLKDTVSMISNYADLICMRSPVEGSAKAASMYSTVPLINAGDGGHLHPTQTLTDLTTIMQKRGQIDGLNIAMCGDLKNGRTVHSLIKALCRFKNIQFYLVAPRELTIPPYIRDLLTASGNKFYEVTGLDPVISMIDVLYMTRIQRERFSNMREYDRLKGIYILDTKKMKHARKDMIVMHPLPRVDEIEQAVDDDPRAVYFEQARYGMFIRMSLICSLSHLPRENGVLLPAGTRIKCKNPRCVTQTEKYLPKAVKENYGVKCCAYCDKELKAKK